MVIYKIVNKINGKTYVGMDANNNPSYFGSGVAIKRAIKKHGKHNFKKIILEEGFSCAKEMAKAEQKWIFFEKTNNPKGVYNLNSGGLGCSGNKGKKSHEIYGTKKGEEWKLKISNTLKRKKIKPPSRLGVPTSEAQKKAASETGKKMVWTKEQKEKSILSRSVKIYCDTNKTEYKSVSEAARSLCLHTSNISKVLSGERKKTGGFVFRRILSG